MISPLNSTLVMITLSLRANLKEGLQEDHLKEGLQADLGDQEDHLHR
jgi:hypothetical protein|tara:strand:- start:991 stop:1131 length:141 start_codon:yes stop_codon:yes gene_type:complete